MNFVRCMIVLFCLALAVMVGYKFFWVEPVGEITPELITVLLIILVLVLSESFDSFSIGKLFEANRKLDEKVQESAELKSENRDLRNQLINITSNVNQRQTSTNNIVLPSQFAGFNVQQADADEVTTKNEEPAEAVSARVQRAQQGNRQTINMSEVENFAISYFIKANKLEQFSLINDAKLTSHFLGIDPIAITTPIFDGYVNTGESEIFIEVRPANANNFMYRDRLYVMLTKLMHYRQAKKTNVYLNLLVVRIHGDERSQLSNPTDIIKRDFEPALTSGLLRIIELNPSAEESAKMFADV